MRTSRREISSSSPMATKEQDHSRGTGKFGNKKSGSTSGAKAAVEFGKKENDDDSDQSSHEEVDVTNKSDNQTAREKPEKQASQVKRNTPPKDPQLDRSRETSQLRNSEKSKKTKASKKEEPEGPEGPGLWAIFVYSTILLVTVLAIIMAPIVIPEELKPYIGLAKGLKENAKFDYVKIFDNRLKEMKMQFPNQTSRFWTILEKRGLAHLKNKQPTQPLVILMGAPPSAHSVIDCMAWKLAQTLDPVNDNLGYIDGTRFTSYSSDKAKKMMDERLERLFQKGDRSALILHLELLPPPSPFLFYSYCDTENAPFKEAGIIFTVHLPEEPDMSLLPAEREGIIERYLAEAVWSKFDDQDGVSALLSRIADTVALVSGEADEVVKLNCPTHLS